MASRVMTNGDWSAVGWKMTGKWKNNCWARRNRRRRFWRLQLARLGSIDQPSSREGVRAIASNGGGSMEPKNGRKVSGTLPKMVESLATNTVMVRIGVGLKSLAVEKGVDLVGQPH